MGASTDRNNLIRLETAHDGEGDLTIGQIAKIIVQYPEDARVEVTHGIPRDGRPGSWRIHISWYRKNDLIRDGEHFVKSKQESS